MVIAVSGPRILTEAHHRQAALELQELADKNADWHIGDARGLDALAAAIANSRQKNVNLYYKSGNLPPRARGAERSTRMVRALARTGGVLHAWPNKPAPALLKPARSWPKNAEGSGTWGTIALAAGLGLRVQLHPLEDLGQLPNWLLPNQQPQGQQLTLL